MARPASFDREQVLERATQAFWEHGYCGTSISQLVEATRLNPGSLYAAFDSKQGLFLAALDHYAGQSLLRLRRVLDRAPDPLRGIETFLLGTIQGAVGAGQRRGCLLVNSVLEVGRHDAAVQRRVKGHLDEIEALFAAALRDAQAAGLVAADRSVEALATFLMTTIWGLRVLAGSGAGVEQQTAVVHHAMSSLRT